MKSNGSHCFSCVLWLSDPQVIPILRHYADISKDPSWSLGFDMCLSQLVHLPSILVLCHRIQYRDNLGDQWQEPGMQYPANRFNHYPGMTFVTDF